MRTFKPCSITGCVGGVVGRGLCGKHWARWRKHGDPLGGRAPNGEPERWARQLAIRTDLPDECIQWPFSLTSTRYGQVRINGRLWKAHRFIYAIHSGVSPDPTTQTCHSCGNPICVNPRHLRWCSQSENYADSVQHGTAIVGTRHGRSKLTEADALTIFSSIDTNKHLAERFGVSISLVSAIRNGRKWRHVTIGGSQP